MKPRGLNKNWRRDWDSNPGGGSRPPDGFQDRCIQPLCHPSAGACIGILLDVRGAGEQSAKNPWQCQNWVAWGPCVPEIVGSARTGWQKPDNPGSANAQWRMGPRCQESLAVPMLSGVRGSDARKTWQCQLSVARAADARAARAPRRCGRPRSAAFTRTGRPLTP